MLFPQEGMHKCFTKEKEVNKPVLAAKPATPANKIAGVVKAFIVTGEEDYFVALGATNSAEFRVAVAAAGLVREHAAEEGYEHLEPLQAWLLKNEHGEWMLDASATTPGAQPAMVAIAFWAQPYDFAAVAQKSTAACQACAVQQGTHVPMGTVVKQIQEPQKFTGDSEMRRAFEIEYGQDWTDPDWRKEMGVWASAWHKATAAARELAAVQQGVQPPFMYAIADGYGQPFFEEEGCVSSEAKDLQPEVDSLNENLDGEPPYKVVALYTHPTKQGLNADHPYKQAIEEICVGGVRVSLKAELLARAAAIAANTKTAEAQEMARNGGCGCCANACADRVDGCRFVHEAPSAADMSAAQAKQGVS